MYFRQFNIGDKLKANMNYGGIAKPEENYEIIPILDIKEGEEFEITEIKENLTNPSLADFYLSKDFIKINYNFKEYELVAHFTKID